MSKQRPLFDKFKVDWLRSELNLWLNTHCADAWNNNSWHTNAWIEDTDHHLMVTISPQDQLTVVAAYEEDHIMAGTDYKVMLGVGRWYPPDEHGLYMVGKCFIMMHFNFDLSLYNVDVFHIRACFDDATEQTYTSKYKE